MKKTKVIKLDCGHIIEEYSRWCPSCSHRVAKIEYGEAGTCPYCNVRYPVDRWKFYVEKK
jgi:uncharacterized CHY-type Zn-finger protein